MEEDDCRGPSSNRQLLEPNVQKKKFQTDSGPGPLFTAATLRILPGRTTAI